MANKKIIRKRKGINRLNILVGGGTLNTNTTKASAIGSAATGTISMINSTKDLAGIPDTNIQGTIDNNYNFTSNASNNESLMNEWGSTSFQDEISYDDVRGKSGGERAGDIGKTTLAGAGTGAAVGSLFGPAGTAVGGIIGGAVGLVSSTVGNLFGNKKAKKEAKNLNQQRLIANERKLSSLENTASNIDYQNDFNVLANYSAYGGYLGEESGAINYEMENRELQNKEMSTMNKARITALPNYFEDTRVKTLEHGGDLGLSMFNNNTNGGVFSNGAEKINNGGTHEENINGGVPMGVDENGTPNLVEEGEVKFNDYIFSNRLSADENLLKAHFLPTSYANHSFADIAEKLSIESSERPNDPISMKGLVDSMNKLQQAQEAIKSIDQEGNKFEDGGPLKVRQLENNGLSPLQNDFDFDYTLAESSPSVDTRTPSKFGKFMTNPANLRYAPVVASGIASVTDVLGLTNKPDYSSADMIGDSVNNLRDVSYNPLSNYLEYNPLDRDFYSNKLAAQAGATRRDIINQSGGNRATATAGLLAADYNTQSQMGNLFRQAEEYNAVQRERVEGFNRGTNQANSQMDLQAQQANQRNDSTRLQARIAEAQMIEGISGASGAARNANLSDFINSVGDVGKERVSSNMANSDMSLYYYRKNDGTQGYKDAYYKLSDSEKKKVDAKFSKGNSSAKGGFLTIRKRK